MMGGGLAGAAGFALYAAWPLASASSGMIQALAVVSLAEVYGLWKLAKGVVCLVRPQAERRSIPDMEQGDLIE